MEMENTMNYWEFFYVYEKVIDERKILTVIKDKFKGTISSADALFPGADALEYVYKQALEKNPQRHDIGLENFFLAHSVRISLQQFNKLKSLEPAPVYDHSVSPAKKIHRPAHRTVHHKKSRSFWRRVFLGS